MPDEQPLPPELDLPALGLELATARAAVEDVKRRMKDAAAKASKLGVPETAIAHHFGVNRLTVREWLGKKPAATKPPAPPADAP